MVNVIAIVTPYIKKIVGMSWQFFTGVVVALVAFAGNFMDLKRPDLTVEITAVTKTSTEPVDLSGIRELSSLREAIPFIAIRSLPVEEVDHQLQIAANRLSQTADETTRYESRLASLISHPADDQEGQLQELKGQIGTSQYSAIGRSFESTKEEKLAQAERIKALTKEIDSLIEKRRKDNTDNSTKLGEAQKQWATYKATILPDKERLSVTCAVGNRGSGATSLEPQALLRANLGSGNYFDLPMKLKGYESSPDLATLQSHTYKILQFQSDAVGLMNQADKERFKTFLGNVSPATIFVGDVNARTYASNSVPFSPGLYEQKVYDTLKQFASKTGNH